MRQHGTKRGHVLLVDSEMAVRSTISRYLQLHGMDVMEVDTPQEATDCLSAGNDFDLLVTELMTPDQSEWDQWERMITQDSEVSLLVHGRRIEEWNEISSKISRETGAKTGFIGRPFTFSDFHWALQQLL